MKNITDFQSNDNNIISLHYDKQLSIIIKTWDNKRYKVEFFDCGKIELNSWLEFEIGELIILSGDNFKSKWEDDFIKENACYKDYNEIIFYDSWNSDRINLRLIYKNYIITEL